jgi:hypothetical protein
MGQPLSRTASALLLGAALVACSQLETGRRQEPKHQWFAFYAGPMRPVEQVAVLCKAERSTDIVTIRAEGGARPSPARRERWHLPQCIEVPAGTYRLEVRYFSRETHFEGAGAITETMESAAPTTAEWVAEAGGLYRLGARLGAPAPAPGLKPRSPRESATTAGHWYVRSWEVEIERVASWEELGESLLERRESWRRYRDGR